jgi:hypothetical protein
MIINSEVRAKFLLYYDYYLTNTIVLLSFLIYIYNTIHVLLYNTCHKSQDN